MKIYPILLLILSLTMAAGCSMTSFYSGGQVVSASNENISFFVGGAGGLQVGDIMHVYRSVDIADDTGSTFYEKHLVGKLKLTKITGDGFAEGNLVEGEIMQHDFVQLVAAEKLTSHL